MTNKYAEQIIRARKNLLPEGADHRRTEDAAEGGCGVLGFAANMPIPGRHVLSASRQMHNRGNGKGGGIAMAGLEAGQVKVDPETLRSNYLLQIALLDTNARLDLENLSISPFFEIAQAYELEHLDDYRGIPGLSVRPPDVWRYFVRVKGQVLERFAEEKGLSNLPLRALEDEFVYQNSYQLNRQFYASLGEKRAFVLSHGRNLSVLKMVGYAEDVVDYYCLQDLSAYVWIAHQRYPTKGRVWHPGGAHPFVGLNEALVHNGDFANYHAVSEYLRQRNIGQLFLTDTEVSVQLFDLWDRVYGYPLEITLEAMAPTSEFDFEMLPEAKKTLYQAVQRTHIHGSPDGPWFFIVARSLEGEVENSQCKHQADRFELLGITDTSMLRPQVFALYENLDTVEPVQIGLIASERQAINACLRSLSAEDSRFQPLADRYWVARGGSYTDGGAFRFTVQVRVDETHPAKAELVCEDKFGRPKTMDHSKHQVDPTHINLSKVSWDCQASWERAAYHSYDDGGVATFWKWLDQQIPELSWDELAWGLKWLGEFSKNGAGEWLFTLNTLNLLRDRRYNTGRKKRASILGFVDSRLTRLFDEVPLITDLPAQLIISANDSSGMLARRLTWDTRQALLEHDLQNTDEWRDSLESPLLVIDALAFPPEGDEAMARWIVRAYRAGWRRMIVYNWRGGRFAGCGLGPDSIGLTLDFYGDVGDYCASGLDGAQVTIHGDGQDQLGQVMKGGKLVIHGDAGQTFLYGAKGGEIFVFGSVAGRPLINAVGKPRAVINGACLDYLAESFMAGDPLKGGGFVVLNGIRVDNTGRIQDLENPYPGGNLFSLASGGAIYLRDPHRKISADQLNGGMFVTLSPEDWAVIEPYLRENERLFGISLAELLSVDGDPQPPSAVYRKVTVCRERVLQEEKFAANV